MMMVMVVQVLLLFMSSLALAESRRSVGGVSNNEESADGTPKKRRSASVKSQVQKGPSYEDLAAATQLQVINRQRTFLEQWVAALGKEEDMKEGRFTKAIGQTWTGDDYFNSYNRKVNSFLIRRHELRAQAFC